MKLMKREKDIQKFSTTQLTLPEIRFSHQHTAIARCHNLLQISLSRSSKALFTTTTNQQT